MSTPDEPQNPYGATPPQQPAEPQQPAQPQYGAPQAPQYPAPPVPGYGAPQAPEAPQYGAPQASPYPAASQYPAAGAAYPPPAAYGAGYGPSPTAKNSLGTWSLVLGILAVLQICSLVTGIVAIVLGNNAKQAVARGEANNGGAAKAGVILGIIGLVLWAILLVVIFSNRTSA